MINQSDIAEFTYDDALDIARQARKVKRAVYRYGPNRQTNNDKGSWSGACAVQITGKRDAETNMYPGHIVAFEPYDKTWEPVSYNTETGPQKCWLILDAADVGLEEDSDDLIGYLVNGMLVGSTMPSDDLPIVFRSQQKTAVSTSPEPTTTVEPCSGDCGYEYDFTTKTWALISSDCSEGCVCPPPIFCPPAPLALADCTDTITYYTTCRRGSYATPVYPNCTGTTTTPNPATTTTTTTIPPSCGTQCKWYYDPSISAWTRVDVESFNCGAGDVCYCNAPVTVPADLCAYELTPCIYPPVTTQPPCGGYCGWIHNGFKWIKKVNTCSGNCQCDTPGAVGACNDTAITVCLPPDGGNPSYTTSPPPYGCNAYCIYQYFDGLWTLVKSDCPGCECAAPTDTGEDCEYRIVACGVGTTTTSTTTTTTTTTTPAPGTCIRHCKYEPFIESCSPLVIKWRMTSTECEEGAASGYCVPGQVFELKDLPPWGAVLGQYNARLLQYGSCEAIVDAYCRGVYPCIIRAFNCCGYDFCCDASDVPTTTTTTGPTTTATPEV
jgi:hypothetical protein